MGFYDDLNNDIYYIVEVEKRKSFICLQNALLFTFRIWVKSFYISVLHSGISKIQFLMK